jgi:hypothetical protein
MITHSHVHAKEENQIKNSYLKWFGHLKSNSVVLLSLSVPFTLGKERQGLPSFIIFSFLLHLFRVTSVMSHELHFSQPCIYPHFRWMFIKELNMLQLVFYIILMQSYQAKQKSLCLLTSTIMWKKCDIMQEPFHKSPTWKWWESQNMNEFHRNVQ